MSTLENHRRNLQDPPIEFRPELRWWLAEGLHTDETLRSEIAAAHRLGFGGMEFLAMDEVSVDHHRYGWGAEEWTHDSMLVVEETTAREMSVSFTSGTNWSNANLPGIDPDHPAAAKELNFVSETLRQGAARGGALPQIDLNEDRPKGPIPGHRVAPREQSLVAVIAMPVLAQGEGSNRVDVDGVLDLTALVVDGTLAWRAPDQRDWTLFVFWMHGTGQTASPSASTNYTVNYLDPAGADAVIDYWESTVLTPELRAVILRNPRAQMYMDSLELMTWGAGGMFWGSCFIEEFRSRRGYDIVPWLPLLVRETGFMAVSTRYLYEPHEQHATTVAKVRHDYVDTLTDLYIENMLRPFVRFLHSHGIKLRAEISYGLPFELTRPGPEVDGIETESLEFGSQIDAYRLLAGPAHLFDKQYSSETGATTRNYMLDHRFYDQIIATQLAAGVTKTVLHGWSSTAGAEGATHWPGHEGMWSMFSERFDLRQPSSEFYPLWNRAIGRFQYALRQGRPRIDVGILRSDYFVDNLSGLALVGADGERIADEDAYARMWMRNRQNHWWQDLGMQDAGWTYEFFDPTLLLRDEIGFTEGVVQPSGPGYQALIVFQETLDAEVASLLLGWAQQGLRLLIVNGARELRFLMAGQYRVHKRAAEWTPGLDGRDKELLQTMAALATLPNVAVVDDPAMSIAALRGLGVLGRAEFAADNTSVLTHLREDGEFLHLYLYNFLYETGADSTVEIMLPGEGLAYRVDVWSGSIRPYPEARIVSGRTKIALTLSPGETALFVLDRSAYPVGCKAPVISEIAAINDWQIAVESWDAGDNIVITEDRGLGYETREIRPTTKVTRLVSPSRALAPWSELEGIGGEVSGVGEYSATFTLDILPAANERILLDLGSTQGGLGSVSLNGAPPVGFDTSKPVIDITDAVWRGENEVTVRVASSLNNRLLARGYYDSVPDVMSMLTGVQAMQKTHVRFHGLMGPVRVLRES